MTQASTNSTFHRQTNQTELGRPVDANSVEFLNVTPPDLATNAKRIWVDQVGETLSFTVDGVNIHTIIDNNNINNLGIINVKLPPFNATGNGVTDDRAAIQSAVNAAFLLRFSVFIPGGGYFVSSAINLPNGATIRGDGLVNTAILTTNAGGAFTASATNKFIELSDLTIQPKTGISTGIGVDTSNIGQSIFQNIVISRFATGVKLDSTSNVCYYNNFINLRIEECTAAAVFMGVNANGHNFVGCRAIQCQIGVDLDTGASGNNFNGMMIEISTPLPGTAYGFRFGSGVTGNTLTGCRIEMQGTGETLFGTSATADNNTVLGSTIFVSIPASGGSSFKGFSGTVGLNNTVINGVTPTTLKAVSTIDSVDSTLSPVTMRLRTKTASGQGLRVFGYKADNVTLIESFNILTSKDAPTFNILFDTLLQVQGFATVGRDLEYTSILRGPIVRTPDGTKKYRLGVDNAGSVVTTLVP